MIDLDAATRWDYADPRQYLEHARYGVESLPPLIVTVAITGGVQGKEVNAALPETPAEQAQSTFDAWNAGASIVHVHARRADNPSRMSHETARYLEINARIRDRCPDIVINNTMTGDVIGTPDGHCRFEWGSLSARPEMVAVDCGPVAYRLKLARREAPLSGRDDEVVVDDIFLTTYGELEALVDRMAELGIKPEFELYNSGQYSVLDALIARPTVVEPYLVQFVLGAQNANYPTPMDLLHMVERLPPGSLFSTIGIGAHQLPLCALSIVLGGHVRVGLEDSVYYARGRKAASNAELVERVVALASLLGREVARPATARKMLGLRAEPTEYPAPTPGATPGGGGADGA
ncbi:MAG: 3-keto-5-aminohexanoate cleavage protein [Actinomycetota bacterium]|nr:3-keto-5-aminohexanoate cleavage protein [Actinomycetota bacterium]